MDYAWALCSLPRPLDSLHHPLCVSVCAISYSISSFAGGVRRGVEWEADGSRDTTFEPITNDTLHLYIERNISGFLPRERKHNVHAIWGGGGDRAYCHHSWWWANRNPRA